MILPKDDEQECGCGHSERRVRWYDMLTRQFQRITTAPRLWLLNRRTAHRCTNDRGACRIWLACELCEHIVVVADGGTYMS